MLISKATQPSHMEYFLSGKETLVFLRIEQFYLSIIKFPFLHPEIIRQTILDLTKLEEKILTSITSKR
jgi:hypothetical protein